MTARASSLLVCWDVLADAASEIRARLAELAAGLGAPASFAAETLVVLLRAHAVCLRFTHTALPTDLSCVWDWLAVQLAPECLAHFETLARLQLPRGERSYVADASERAALGIVTEQQAAQSRFYRQFLALFGMPFSWRIPASFSTYLAEPIDAEPVLTDDVVLECAD